MWCAREITVLKGAEELILRASLGGTSHSISLRSFAYLAGCSFRDGPLKRFQPGQYLEHPVYSQKTRASLPFWTVEEKLRPLLPSFLALTLQAAHSIDFYICSSQALVKHSSFASHTIGRKLLALPVVFSDLLFLDMWQGEVGEKISQLSNFYYFSLFNCKLFFTLDWLCVLPFWKFCTF